MLGEGLSWLIVWHLVLAAGEILRARCAWNLLWDPNEIWPSHESPYLRTWHQLVTAVLALPQGHPPVVFTPVSLLLMGRLYSYIDNNSTQHPLQAWTILSVWMESIFSAMSHAGILLLTVFWLTSTTSWGGLSSWGDIFLMDVKQSAELTLWGQPHAC